MEPEPSVNQPSTSLAFSFPRVSDEMPSFSAIFAGLPSIDRLPVEKTFCIACETVVPRIRILGAALVICPECRTLNVDESK